MPVMGDAAVDQIFAARRVPFSICLRIIIGRMSLVIIRAVGRSCCAALRKRRIMERPSRVSNDLIDNFRFSSINN